MEGGTYLRYTMKMIPRDFQRSKVYHAEWNLLDGRELWPELETSWEFLAGVVRGSQFRKRFPQTFVAAGGMRWPSKGLPSPDRYSPNGRLVYLHYGDRRGGLKLKPGYRRTHAESQYTTVVLPLWARNDLTLLHELAHICTWYDMKPVSAHGREFVQTYLRLVEGALGKGVSKELAEVMDDNRVKWAA